MPAPVETTVPADALAPCPFCHNPQPNMLTLGDSWYVECGRCTAQMVAVTDQELAAENWNNRTGKRACPACLRRGVDEWGATCLQCGGKGEVATDGTPITDAAPSTRPAEVTEAHAAAERFVAWLDTRTPDEIYRDGNCVARAYLASLAAPSADAVAVARRVVDLNILGYPGEQLIPAIAQALVEYASRQGAALEAERGEEHHYYENLLDEVEKDANRQSAAAVAGERERIAKLLCGDCRSGAPLSGGWHTHDQGSAPPVLIKCIATAIRAGDPGNAEPQTKDQRGGGT